MDETLAVEAAAAAPAAEQTPSETLEEVMSRHRKEKSKLQDKETSLKKAAAKGSKAEQKAKKKQVEEEISRLSVELVAKHAKELASFGYKTAESSEKGNLETLVKAIAGVSVSSNADSAKQPGKAARRREKKAKEEAAREQRIQEEQTNLVSDRMVEDEKLEKRLEPLGLTIHEIKPDGHCLYRAIENQLSLHSRGTTQYSHQELRQMTAKYMREHAADFLPFFLSEGKAEAGPDPSESFERYCQEMFGTFALSVGAAVGMEFWARWAHRALWHASLWHMHESHHRPRDGPFELNDVFAIVNAVPAMSLLAFGFFNRGLVPGLCFGAGLGITLFGMAYMFVHDGLVHRRFPVGPIENVPYFRRVAAAHQIHHMDKFDSVPYGLFLGPKELEEVGGTKELEKEIQRRIKRRETLDAMK